MGMMNFSVLRKGFYFSCVCLALAACGSVPAATVPPPQGGASGRSRPAWVTSVDSVYGGNQYIAAVGTGNDRHTAERNALAALVSRFGQSIVVDEKISSFYQDAVRNGVITNWTENNTMQSNISTSASMDTLVGAEIKEVWDDRGTVYAAAVMEKARTAQLYSDMIKANLSMINNLVTMTPAEKNTLEGYSRYQFAAVVADINISHENVLKVIGAPSPGGVKSGFDYRQELVNIASAIPVAVTVRGDRQGRIQGAISRALSDRGFRSGGNNSRYTVNAELVISEVQLANQVNKFARYEITANLVDTSLRQTLIPYTANGREGHTTLSEAENRAVAALERKINEEYKELLNDYLSRMLPKK